LKLAQATMTARSNASSSSTTTTTTTTSTTSTTTTSTAAPRHNLRSVIWDELLELFIDLPFLLLSFIVIFTFWRTSLLYQAIVRANGIVGDAQKCNIERRRAVLVQLSLLFVDILALIPFSVVLCTLYKLPSLIGSLKSKLSIPLSIPSILIPKQMQLVYPSTLTSSNKVEPTLLVKCKLRDTMSSSQTNAKKRMVLKIMDQCKLLQKAKNSENMFSKPKLHVLGTTFWIEAGYSYLLFLFIYLLLIIDFTSNLEATHMPFFHLCV
jgi:hypothetical protein